MLKSFKDQTGREILINWPPKRIVSLVPSQTELLYTLGLNAEITGITKFCIHPKEWFKTKIKIGGTKQLKIDAIEALQPNLIIANKEENEEGQIKELMKKYPVWVSEIYSLEDSFNMIKMLSEVCNAGEKGEKLIAQIKNNRTQFKDFLEKPNIKKNISVLYLIWRKPFMAAASNTFINYLLIEAGFLNVLANEDRYPELDAAKIKKLKPEVIFLSSEPYPFKEKHIEELKTISPASKIILVDGELFSWYGSRLLYSYPYFTRLWEENFN